MVKISKEQVSEKIDSRFHNKLSSSQYEIKTIPARELLSHRRVDIYVKMKLAEAWLNSDSEREKYYQNLYLETIKIFTRNSFVEPGDSNKSSAQDFVDSFKALFFELQENYDEDLHYIPISGNNTPLDGAHRIAILALLNRNVKAVVVNEVEAEYGLKHFEKHGANIDLIQKLATIALDFDSTLRVAVVWPNGVHKYKDIIKEYGDALVYTYSLNLSKNGINTLCAIAYKNEEWTGKSGEAWQGARRKGKHCFKFGQPTKFMIFETRGEARDIELKESIRKICGGGKHSIHSTDNVEETKDIVKITLMPFAKVILNKLRLKTVAKCINSLDIDYKNQSVFTGSIALELFSMREANDIDVISIDANVKHSEEVGLHNDYMHWYPSDLILYFEDPSLTYNIMGYRFISLNEVLGFKTNRDENKDKRDIRAINYFKAKNGIVSEDYKMKFKDKLYFFKLSIKKRRKELKKKIKSAFKSN